MCLSMRLVFGEVSMEAVSVRWTQDLSDSAESKYNNVTLQNQNTSQKWTSSKNSQTINAGEGVGEGESSYTVVGNVNWYRY